MRKMKARPRATLLCRNLHIQQQCIVGICLAGIPCYVLGPFLQPLLLGYTVSLRKAGFPARECRLNQGTNVLIVWSERLQEPSGT